MIIGVGVDLVDIDEFRGRLNDELIEELFLPDEAAYARTQRRSWENLAARLAAKEAAFKALGAGLSQGQRWRDVEVRREESGAVSLALHGKARELADKKTVKGCKVSLSHSRSAAIAIVIMES
jgi:holo-[acyl-carrier protein] synthase